MRAPNIDLNTAQETIRDITIPAQPQILLDVRQAHPDIDKIAALISRDPATGAAVLKTVNSPMFGIPKRIVKIEQAVMLLGLDSVMNIVNAVLLKASLSQKTDPAKLKDFWQISNDTAVATSYIARKLKLVSPDQAFVLGLFHNCAMPLMLDKFEHYFDTLASAYQEHSRALTDLEDEQFQANHAIIGAHIARAWYLPQNVIEAIEDHHSPARLMCSDENGDPSADDPSPVDILCAILKFAEHAVGEHKVLGRNEEDYEWQCYSDRIIACLDLHSDDADNLIEEVTEAVNDADLDY